ncbi:hypothetical protein FHETE_534 [Fusarium heterosporum]|uniref:Uncharacterized protein n=1 Tax=Fusarium heterosporum TaxID=42747 RepID=A0A8H5TXY2_FUSHE|nr:hypothetical protein FHETE_534 [Fusarium heterosporum]
MTQAALEQHVQDMTRRVRQAAPASVQNATREKKRFYVKATYENGHQSWETVQFDYTRSLSFCSQAFLSKLREDSRAPIDFIPVPPIYRSALTPDEVVDPITYFIWAKIEYESLSVPFPPTWIPLYIYRGTGAVSDITITLGRDYSDLLEKRATA